LTYKGVSTFRGISVFGNKYMWRSFDLDFLSI